MGVVRWKPDFDHIRVKICLSSCVCVVGESRFVSQSGESKSQRIQSSILVHRFRQKR